MKIKVKLAGVLFFVSAITCANATTTTTATTNFVAGKDYQIISTPNNLPANFQLQPGKVQMLEFFNYGCPACDHFEPHLEQWLKTKPANVTFNRIPVVFEQGWDVYAKAYYVAGALDIESKLTPIIFNAIHQQGLNLASESAMQAFFVKNGVNGNEFAGAYNYSTAIALQLNQATAMMQSYQVMEIPTVIINGEYKISPSMVGGDDTKMLKIIDYLIAKSQAQT